MKRILFGLLLIAALAAYWFTPAPVAAQYDNTSSGGPRWDGLQPTIPPPGVKPVDPPGNEGPRPVQPHPAPACNTGPGNCPPPFDQAH